MVSVRCFGVSVSVMFHFMFPEFRGEQGENSETLTSEGHNFSTIKIFLHE